MFFRKKKDKEEDNVIEAGKPDGSSLYLYVSENGWKAQFVSPENEPEGEVETGGVPEIDASRDERIENTIKHAAKIFTKKRLRDVGKVHLLLDEADVAIIDSKENQLRAPNPAMLRELGARQLNTEQTTYGERKFGDAPEYGKDSSSGIDFMGDGPQENLVYAFIAQRTLQNYLSHLDASALKLVSTTPVQDTLLKYVETQDSTPTAAIYISEQNIYIAMMHRGYGIASVRTLPFGKNIIIEAIAAAQSVPLSEAHKALSGRDYISSVDLKAATNEKASLTASVFDKALGPVLKKLLTTINDTLVFFAEQRASGPIKQISFFGDIADLNGLTEFLKSNIPEELNFPKESLLDLFVSHVTSGTANLLTGSEGGLISVGRMNYTFHNNQFVESDALNKERAEIESSRAQQASHGPLTRIRNRKGKNKARASASTGAQAANKGGGSSFLNSLKNLGKKTPPSSSRKRMAGDNEADHDIEARQDRAGFVLVGMLSFGALYAGWTQLEDIDRTHANAVSSIYSELDSQARNRKNLSRQQVLGPSLSVDADKVLWSEKFLSISKNMNEAMWLTDVYLTDEGRKVGDKKVISKKLVMEGAVLPSTDGHILEIARYIRRLLKDEDFFMSDFRDISFEGAQVDASEDDHVVRFTVEAWYDENKRVEEKKKPSSKNPPGLGEMQSSVDERKEKLEKTLGSNPAN